jgi:hypothetical protein
VRKPKRKQQKAGEYAMEYFMVPLLVIISILSIRGVIDNKKIGNKPGVIIGGVFTLALVGVTLLSLYDLFVGIQ